jgi:putative membrane-bound dehydrogenase-like protein
MRRRLSLPLLGLALLLSPGSAQVPPDKALGTFTVVAGLQIQLWAAEPLFVNPTCMDIDERGRVWVCESVNYRNKLHRRPKLNRPAGDRIVILEDTKGTGKADKATTFYQSPELLAPLGIAVARDPAGPGYKVFVCQSPDILVFEDKDGDGKADGPPKKLLSGFGGYDHDHGVHSILIGPDNKLYFTVGDQGVRGLQSSDGQGRVWRTNNTDCQAGTNWRCNLDGTGLEQVGHNFRNQYELCVDSFGTVFLSDNDDDGRDETRICYVMPGGNYGYWPRRQGDSHWHEEQPGVVPKLLRTYRGSPTGICVYEGDLLPKKYRGQLLHTDAGPRHLRCYHLRLQGAGYAIEREDMVTSSDNWFRPSDVCVAPDGSVFVADWYDPGVGGHGMGDTTRGRVYRVAPKGNKPSVPKLDLTRPAGVLEALASPNLATRALAMARLDTLKPAEALKLLEPACSSKNDVLRARALWQYARLGGRKVRDDGPIKALWTDRDPRFQAQAIRIARDYLGFTAEELARHAARLAKDDSTHPSVLREALLSLRDQDQALVKDAIYALMKRYDGKDRFYLAAIGIAVGHHDKARREAILADFARQVTARWNDRVAGLVWELRPPKMLPVLRKYLADRALPAEQRAKLVDILATSNERAAGSVVLGLLSADVPTEVRERALANLVQFLPGQWKELRASSELDTAITRLLDGAETRPAALALITAGGKVPFVPAVRKLAGDRSANEEVRKAAVRTLGQLLAGDSVAALKDLLATEPAGLRLQAALALGELGRGRGAQSKAALSVLQGVVEDGQRALDLRQAAVAGLAASRPGGNWLLELHNKGKLAPAVQETAGRLLRASVFKDVSNKALVAFPAPGKLNPKKLPPIAVLATRTGDANRGKALLAKSVTSNLQCLKCHTVRGVGGFVGPDLSLVARKASRENLLESILLPSKAIADQFLTWQIETRRGVQLSGLIVEETSDHLVLRDAEGRDTRVAKKNVAGRTRSLKSLMPEDLVAYMSEDDLVDMVEYLLTLKTPALAVDWWHIVGPFDNGSGMQGLDRVFPPEKGIDLKAIYAGKSGKIAWRKVKPGPGGYVDLQAFFSPKSANIVSYLTRDFESPAAQDATVLLGTDDGAKLWLNGALVHTARVTRAAAPEQDSVKVKLKKGTNRIVLKINNGAGAHGFYFTVLAEQELKLAGKK